MKESVKPVEKGVKRISRLHNNMELENIVNDTQNLSNRLHAPEVLGPWDPCALVADLAGETGTLAQSVLTLEGIAAAPPDSAHLASDIPRLLYMLVNLGNFYRIDLEHAWNDMIQEGWANIAKMENKEAETKSD
jgi:hypothetical protein